MTDHAYSTYLTWHGATGVGYRQYSRQHDAVAQPATATLQLSADRAFRGNPDLLNPEQLLVMAVSSCQLLSFLALAARRHVDVVGYEDRATGAMSEGCAPTRISDISLSPVIQVAAGTDHAAVRALVEEAHDGCFIANSLTTSVTIDATILDA